MLSLRRWIVWTVSVVTGTVATVGAIVAFQTTLDKFSVSNAILIFVAFGSLAFIWLDLIFQTNYLRR